MPARYYIAKITTPEQLLRTHEIRELTTASPAATTAPAGRVLRSRTRAATRSRRPLDNKLTFEEKVSAYESADRLLNLRLQFTFRGVTEPHPMNRSRTEQRIPAMLGEINVVKKETRKGYLQKVVPGEKVKLPHERRGWKLREGWGLFREIRESFPDHVKSYWEEP